MKIKYSAAVVLIFLSISACSNQRTLEKSTYNYPNPSTTGTTVKLIAQRILSYKLIIDDSITININPPMVLTRIPTHSNDPNSIQRKLYTNRKRQVTINNLPAGDHRFIIQTKSNYPIKRINETLNITTKAGQNTLLVKTRKYKYRTAYKVANVFAYLAAVASLTFVLAFASLGGQ